MAKGFHRLKLSYSHRDLERFRRRARDRPPGLAGRPAGPDDKRASAEAVAREFLGFLTVEEAAPAFRSFGADAAPEAAGPGTRFAKRTERREAITNTDLVDFEQVKDRVPVFGSRAVVEVDDRQEVVSASIDVADVAGIDTEPTVSPEQAARTLGERIRLDPGSLPEPQRTILPHPDEDGRLHLTWHFAAVPQEPPPSESEPEGPRDDRDSDRGGCVAHRPFLEPSFDYFVDAHDGSLIYWFSNAPHLDVPTRCRGLDEEGDEQTFLGRVADSGYEMDNPFEDIRTLDLGLSAIETTPLPADAIHNATYDWADTNRAGVSAHVNSARVLDFLYRFLRRKSIDDEGMTLTNVVRCFSENDPSAPEWINAVWWKGKMWYGQESLGSGSYRSLARHLDVIAHELFHGVTEHTAQLVYEGLPGALNESFSDIFGVIIRNWHLATDAGDPSTWVWEIGDGLGSGGDPLRDMSDPGRVGQWRKPDAAGTGWTSVDGYPAHMSEYVKLPATKFYDWGGVHWYSNIHNFAAYKVLTSVRANGTPVFAPEEVAVLYYLVLTRLSRLSDFDDARTELLTVSATVFAGIASRAAEVQAAIENAYDDVGIA